jgi:CRP-like cAMP-binding protein
MQGKVSLEQLILMGGDLVIRPALEMQALFNAAGSEELYPAGFRLFSQGDSPAGLFLIQSGRIRLSTGRTMHRFSSPQWAEAGDLLGLNASLHGIPYAATAETTASSQVSFAPREQFLRFLRDSPQAAFGLVEILSHEVYKTYEHARSLSKLRRRPRAN